MSNLYYLLRSRKDGRYLSAQPDRDRPSTYLLLFQRDFDALGYLQAHAPEVSDRFAVETLASNQLRDMLKRWGYEGVGLVADPLTPQVDFLKRELL